MRAMCFFFRIIFNDDRPKLGVRPAALCRTPRRIGILIVYNIVS